MAVESKPLFLPEVLRQQVRAFRLPERMAALLPRLNLRPMARNCANRSTDVRPAD